MTLKRLLLSQETLTVDSMKRYRAVMFFLIFVSLLCSVCMFNTDNMVSTELVVALNGAVLGDDSGVRAWIEESWQAAVNA